MPTIRRQPFSPQKVVRDANTEAGYFLMSPIKDSNGSSFSPFKNSTLSPFKQINQSPSKGALDAWDKDFISGFEENLFGMHDLGDLSDSVIGELMKSPQGKALLQKAHSPVRVNTSGRSRKQVVSQHRDAGARGVVVSVTNSGAVAKTAVVKVKEEPIEFYTVIKQEPVDEPELHSEHNYHVGHSPSLSVTDPDKMNATPIKLGQTKNGKTAPKRNLAFMDNSENAANLASRFNSITHHTDSSSSIGIAFHLWPSKERLKFAREHFRKILDKTVKDKIEKYRASQAVLNKGKQDPIMNLKRKITSKHKSKKKHKAGKLSKKVSKRDRYPQIKQALAKPTAVSQNSRKSALVANPIIPKARSHGFVSRDPGWYPDEDNSEDSDSGSWQGPVPFQKPPSPCFYGSEYDTDSDNVYVDIDVSSDDEEYYPSVGEKKRKLSGKETFGKKKRKR